MQYEDHINFTSSCTVVFLLNLYKSQKFYKSSSDVKYNIHAQQCTLLHSSFIFVVCFEKIFFF